MRVRLARTRLGAAVLAGFGVVVGAAPHVLHHAGPLAGAALLAAASGTLLFGALGLLLSITFLRRLLAGSSHPDDFGAATRVIP